MGVIYSIISYPTYILHGSSVPDNDDASFKAVSNNDFQTLRQLINRRNVNVNVHNDNGFTLLQYACELGHEECVKILLSSSGINVNQKDTTDTPFGQFESTALHIAASEGYPNIVIELLESGADINAINVIGWTPLHYAIITDHITAERLESIVILLSFGANVNTRDREGNMPIDAAILYGHCEVTRVLLNYGANISHIEAVDPKNLQNDGVFQCIKICIAAGCSRVIEKYDVVNYIMKNRVLNHNDDAKEYKENFLPKIECLLEMKSNIQSLKYLSRLTIRKYLNKIGVKVSDAANCLLLPDSLRWYLLLIGVEFN